MIEYKKRTLANGLTVVVNRDKASKLAAVNILYKVGARNENPARTGFAHLFEHLMFRGTRAVENFDLHCFQHAALVVNKQVKTELPSYNWRMQKTRHTIIRLNYAAS